MGTNDAGPLDIIHTVHIQIEDMRKRGVQCTADQSLHFLWFACKAAAHKLFKRLQSYPDQQSCVYFQPGKGKLIVASNLSFGGYKPLCPFFPGWKSMSEVQLFTAIRTTALKRVVYDTETGAVEFVMTDD
jgi:hypothetical protein